MNTIWPESSGARAFWGRNSGSLERVVVPPPPPAATATAAAAATAATAAAAATATATAAAAAAAAAIVGFNGDARGPHGEHGRCVGGAANPDRLVAFRCLVVQDRELEAPGSRLSAMENRHRSQRTRHGVVRPLRGRPAIQGQSDHGVNAPRIPAYQDGRDLYGILPEARLADNGRIDRQINAVGRAVVVDDGYLERRGRKTQPGARAGFDRQRLCWARPSSCRRESRSPWRSRS